jgi:hypothetical protein
VCMYILYIWSRPCESLHAIESKNLSMLLRVLSPWEREGSDAAAVFFKNLDVANTHMSKFLKTLCHTHAQKNICLLMHALVQGSKNMSFLVSDFYSLGSLGGRPLVLTRRLSVFFALQQDHLICSMCIYILYQGFPNVEPEGNRCSWLKPWFDPVQVPVTDHKSDPLKYAYK